MNTRETLKINEKGHLEIGGIESTGKRFVIRCKTSIYELVFIVVNHVAFLRI